MIARIMWRLALPILALATIGVHFDRQAIKTPTFAATVPEPFRGSAQLRVAAEALDSKNPELALAEAKRLVQRRPLPAEHLRLLAQAQFAAGEVGPSTMTIQYAAQRGWRDALAQESLLRLAIDAGDRDEAARRYTALFLRRDTTDALLEQLGPSVLSDPEGEGRATLVTIVGGAKRWHSQFLNRGARVMPPNAFADVIVKASANGTSFDCRLLERTARAVTRRDAAAGARVLRIAEEQC